MEISWADLEQEFLTAEEVISGWILPSEADVRKLRASVKTNGELLKFGLGGVYRGQGRTDASYLTPISDEALFKIYPTLKMLGVELEPSIEDRMPAHLISKANSNARDIICASIKSKSASVEFVKAWGDYKEAVTKFIFFLNSKEIEDQYNSNVLKNLPAIVEKHIYAYYLHEHYIIEGKKKATVELDLAKKIRKILRDPPKDITNEELKALSNMREKDHADLKDTYKSIRSAEILKITEEAIIPRSILKILD